MANGSGSHAKVNNGLPFRDRNQPDQAIVMMGYFFNRGSQKGREHMDFAGSVDISGAFSSDITNELPTTANPNDTLHTTVSFRRVWFPPDVERTFAHDGLEIGWTAPQRENYRHLLADTFLTITLNDGPQGGTSNNQRLVSPIYGVWGTDDVKDDTNASAMRSLHDLRTDIPGAPPLTLRFSYAGLDLQGATLADLKVVQWTDDKGWVLFNGQPTVLPSSQIETTTMTLGTWYALGLGF